jgi:heme-degrading monooxygenase HmoA
MIARMWRGLTPESKADAYLEYLRQTGVRACRATPGNRGVFVLRRQADGSAEFLFVSLWESMQAVQRFAGPDLEKAVYYPEDAAFLLEMEPGVVHYDVLVAPDER